MHIAKTVQRIKFKSMANASTLAQDDCSIQFMYGVILECHLGKTSGKEWMQQPNQSFLMAGQQNCSYMNAAIVKLLLGQALASPPYEVNNEICLLACLICHPLYG